MIAVRRILLIASLLLPWAASAQVAPLVDVGLHQTAVAPSVRIERAAQAEAIMAATLEQTMARLEAAREARDIVQVNCITARVAPLKGLLELVRQSRESLEEAAAGGDRLIVELEARKIAKARARAESFRVQVEGCVGVVSQYTGDTRIDLQIDPGLRRDDPSRAVTPPAFTPISTTRPPPLSASR